VESDVYEPLAFITEEMLEHNAKVEALSRLPVFAALENHRLSVQFFPIYAARLYERLWRSYPPGCVFAGWAAGW